MKSLFATTLSLLALGAAAPVEASVSTTALIGQNNYATPEIRMDCPGCVTSLGHTDNYISDYSDQTVLSQTTVTAYAMADYGVLKSSSTTMGTGVFAYTVAHSYTSFADHFQIDAPGLSGQRGTFMAQVIMPFTQTFASPIYQGQYLYSDIVVNSFNDAHTEQYQLSAGANSLYGHDALLHNGSEVPFNTPMLLEVPFVYSESIAIQGHLNTSVAGHSDTQVISFDVAMDASHSLYWEGIGSVTDASGHAVTGYTLTSDSGTDWSRNFAAAPVPEPGTMLLMFAGMAAFGLRRRGT